MEERKNYSGKLIRTVAAFIITLAVIVTLLPGMEFKADAASLKTAVFPVNNGVKIAYSYGYSKAYGGNHSGIDIHAGKDNKVYCAVSGVVKNVNNSCGHYNSYNSKSKDYGKCNHINTYGNSVYILGDDGWYYIYGHVAKNSITVKAGQRVEAGTAIAKIGSSGASTGPHLHFEVRKKLSSSATKVNVNKNVVFKYVDGPYNDGTLSGAVTEITKNIVIADKIVDGGEYRIRSAVSDNLYIGTAGNKTSSKTNVQLVNKSNAAVWIARYNAKKNYWYFINKKNQSVVLNPYADKPKSKTNVNLYTYCSNDTSQGFYVKKNSDGTFRIFNRCNSNVSLEVSGTAKSARAETNIRLYSNNNDITQKWYFVKA